MVCLRLPSSCPREQRANSLKLEYVLSCDGYCLDKLAAECCGGMANCRERIGDKAFSMGCAHNLLLLVGINCHVLVGVTLSDAFVYANFAFLPDAAYLMEAESAISRSVLGLLYITTSFSLSAETAARRTAAIARAAAS